MTTRGCYAQQAVPNLQGPSRSDGQGEREAVPVVCGQRQGVRNEMILTDADISTFLRKAATVTDAELNALLLVQPAVEQLVKDTVGYDIEQTTHTEFLPERTRNMRRTSVAGEDVVNNRVVPVVQPMLLEDTYLFLPQLPVRTITNIFQDTSAYGGQGPSDFPAASELTAGVDYFVDYTKAELCKSGKLIKISGGSWSKRARTIKVVYVAGYTVTELATGIGAAIKHACLLGMQGAFADLGSETGKVRSERLGDWAATYAVEGVTRLPSQAVQKLQPYVRMSRLF